MRTLKTLIDELHQIASEMGSYVIPVEVNHTPISCVDSSYAIGISNGRSHSLTTAQILLVVNKNGNPVKHT